MSKLKHMTDAVLDEDVTISKMVPGGQGLGELQNGKKVFVWNALPGEVVRIRLIMQRASYAEGIAERVTKASAERVDPEEPNYLATSPWQMMTFVAENKFKGLIVEDIFKQAKVTLPAFRVTWGSKKGAESEDGTNPEFHYRNKMEYSFWGDDIGLHLALHQRGSHGKQIVPGSKLALPSVDAAADAVRAMLDGKHIRASDLKTIIVRSTQDFRTAAALFVKTESFPELELPDNLQGLRVYYSNPKSPASVPTKQLFEYGNCILEDPLLGRTFTYDVNSFFQINLPVYELVLQQIIKYGGADDITDVYAGVGSIGLSVATKAATLVESDESSAAMARVNAAKSGLDVTVIEATSVMALESITNVGPVIFDPPRAGLHDKVVSRLLDVLPPKIIYLSCNPVTQARDIAVLTGAYDIDYFEAFNFFPRTPHIETLAILTKKN